jgi:riboflavin transporter FmnP
MNSKTIAVIVVFAALTAVLSIFSPIRIPAPYAVFLIYQVWEIPIVVAFILFGPLVGVATVAINTIVLLAVFPGSLPVGPLYNFAAVLSMLFGIYVAFKLVRGISLRSEALRPVFSTALGCVLRVVVMTVVNWIFLRYPYPVGYSMPDAALLAMLPIVGVFNFTIALYTVPLGHFVARIISVGLKIEEWGHRTKET